MAKKNARDPGAPKRNMSAYLLYQNAMRNQFKALNPGMTFGQLAKYTSAMYAEMPPAEKEGWVARAEQDKARYLMELSTYVPPPGFDGKGDAIISATSTVGVKTSRRSGKAERDVNAPKRNMSAYLLYQNAMRDQFKRENPGMTFGQLAKYTSHMYKNLTPEEKATWVARAEQDKIRYDAEIADYVPPPGHDARGNMIEDQRPKRRTKRGPKDPAAPKRASGAYVFFTNEMRPLVMKQFPGIKFVEMGRILGERWRALTPDEKSRYENLAAEDKMRFQVEMQTYNANQAAQQQQREQLVQQQQLMQQQPAMTLQAQHAAQAQLHPAHMQHALPPGAAAHHAAYLDPHYHYNPEAFEKAYGHPPQYH